MPAMRNELVVLLLLSLLSVVMCAFGNGGATGNLMEIDEIALPALPYAYGYLEPVIDARTMEIHHSAHHKAYTKNLNNALKEMRSVEAYREVLKQCKTVEDLLRKVFQMDLPDRLYNAIRNQGGGFYNHMLWWQMMTSVERHAAHPRPQGKLADAIQKQFESFDKFRQLISQSANSHFGSGWAWVYLAPPKEQDIHIDAQAHQSTANNKEEELVLHIASCANQDPPLLNRDRVYPILGIDVWEHAHYLKYQNKRPDYVDAWWSVVNWSFVERMYEEAQQRDQ